MTFISNFVKIGVLVQVFGGAQTPGLLNMRSRPETIEVIKGYVLF